MQKPERITRNRSKNLSNFESTRSSDNGNKSFNRNSDIDGSDDSEDEDQVSRNDDVDDDDNATAGQESKLIK